MNTGIVNNKVLAHLSCVFKEIPIIIRRKSADFLCKNPAIVLILMTKSA